jgi:hypothetical protein
VSEGRYRVEGMTSEHDRSGFSCGNEALDRYFQRKAGQEQRRDVARVFLLIDNENDRIAGYYTLSSSAVVTVELPDTVAKRLPGYAHTPAILLGRLAVDLD